MTTFDPNASSSFVNALRLMADDDRIPNVWRSVLRNSADQLEAAGAEIAHLQVRPLLQLVKKISAERDALRARVAELQAAWGLGCCARFVHGDGTHEPDCHKFSSAPHDSSCVSPED